MDAARKLYIHVNDKINNTAVVTKLKYADHVVTPGSKALKCI